MASQSLIRGSSVSFAALLTAGACSLANAPDDPARSSSVATTAASSSTGGGEGGATTSTGSSMGGDGGTVSMANCSDGQANGNETDVDCGGPDCMPCVTGKSCEQPDDCQSKICQEKVCAEPKENGAPCTFSEECKSNQCTAEGVCCNEACDQGCFSCKQENTGQSDGTCSPVTAGQDPGGSCSSNATDCGGDACDGTGNCGVEAAGTTCATSYTCDGKSATCSQKCSSDATCAVGYTCYVTQAECVNLPSCAAFKAKYPKALSGMYTIDPDGPGGKGAARRVYCDMTGQQMYENLSLGSSAKSYVGYTFLTSKVLGVTSVQAAFIALYNSQGGVMNVDPGFSSGNCCIKATQTAGNAMLTFGGQHYFPCNDCNPEFGYTGKIYLLRRNLQTKCQTATLSSTFFKDNPVSSTLACSDKQNPGLFVKKTSF